MFALSPRPLPVFTKVKAGELGIDDEFFCFRFAYGRFLELQERIAQTTAKRSQDLGAPLF